MNIRTSDSVAAAIAAVLLAATPSAASADWLIAGYVGASHTSSTTLQVTDAGTSIELRDIEFRGDAWRSPIYYGYRIGWLPDESPIGVETEFIHAKTIAVATGSPALTQFEQSHGLNFVLGNLSYRARCSGRCYAVVRAGAGVAIPHVEATYLGSTVSSYQLAGPAIQGGMGLELAIHGGLTAIVDGRVTFTKVTNDLPGATLSASFTTWHLTVGVGWRFGL
jgi:opacity protein-like surface antigen